jgi:hypothetical protein
VLLIERKDTCKRTRRARTEYGGVRGCGHALTLTNITVLYYYEKRLHQMTIQIVMAVRLRSLGARLLGDVARPSYYALAPTLKRCNNLLRPMKIIHVFGSQM